MLDSQLADLKGEGKVTKGGRVPKAKANAAKDDSGKKLQKDIKAFLTKSFVAHMF